MDDLVIAREQFADDGMRFWARLIKGHDAVVATAKCGGDSLASLVAPGNGLKPLSVSPMTKTLFPPAPQGLGLQRNNCRRIPIWAASGSTFFSLRLRDTPTGTRGAFIQNVARDYRPVRPGCVLVHSG